MSQSIEQLSVLPDVDDGFEALDTFSLRQGAALRLTEAAVLLVRASAVAVLASPVLLLAAWISF